ncbi:flagellin N-terminal helical domain-containing protein [Mangrovibrevibacter kandeliae]|uniref:flagellin N-terminal helical domain-containing protein n=1 Tax=Mangrovibrevibacter kandeliae TaxID=2968473 RepID=UPI0021174E8D|nr:MULTISPECIES: flagellin [unclassified Aurantimonas]MCQ8780925.1 flagellin [Aurantimonas sp. CSK15Z-1]MCW4113706.1 flagellin [Aurantimonas sp. MSK8Z-1]
MTSVLYNAAATTALRVLQSTNTKLDAVQNRISTGLKIGEAKDNAAYWSISTTLKSDNSAMSSVKDALGLGAATVDTAYTGMNNALDVLNQIKEKLTSATQDGVDAQAVQDEISALQNQLKSIASSSTFSGENWLSVNSGVGGYSATKNVVASFTRDANNSISIGTIDVNTASLKLYDSNDQSGILDGAKQLTKADGTALTVGGTAQADAAPAYQGLDSASVTPGSGMTTASPAVATLGTFNAAGIDTADYISLNLTVDGGSSTYVRVDLTGVATGANLAAAINTGITNAFGSAVATASFDAGTGAIKLTSATTGGASAINVAGVTAHDGDGTTTSVLGFTTGGIPAFGTNNPTSVNLGGTFAAANLTNSIADGDKISFKVQYNGDVYQGSYTFTATGYADPTAPTGDEFAARLTLALQSATKVTDGTALSTNLAAGDAVTVSNTAGTFSIATTVGGPGTDVSMFDITAVEGTGGTAAAATSLGITSAASVAYGSGTNGTFALGTYSNTGYDANDRLSFDMTVYSTVAGAQVANRQTITIASAPDATTFQANLQAAVNATFGAGVLTVNNAAGAISIDTVEQSANAGIAVSAITAQDGNGSATSLLGLSTTATAAGNGNNPAVAASVTGTWTGSETWDDQDAVTFNLAVDGGSPTKVTINKATVDAALGTSDGLVDTAAKWASVLTQALSDASVSGLTVSQSGGNVTIAKTTAGAGSVALSGFTTTTGASTMSVANIDISDSALSALGVDGTNRKDVVSAYISVVSQAITNVTAGASALGAVASRIELQQNFVTDLMDTIDQGVSGLVDADMNEESTKLQALQVQQQLGVQALSIANSSAQNVLRLFQ